MDVGGDAQTSRSPPAQEQLPGGADSDWNTDSRPRIQLGSPLADAATGPGTMTLAAYSPVGLALHEQARMPAGVSPVLRHTRALLNYWQLAARATGDSSPEPWMHQVVRRIALGDAGEAVAAAEAAAPEAVAEDHVRRMESMLEVVRRCSGGRPASRTESAQVAVTSNTAAAADEGEWVSDHSDDDAGHDAALALMRIRARSDARRHQPLAQQPQQQQRRGVAKTARRGASGRAVQQRLAAAYARYQTDEPAIRRTVSEMGQGDADTILQMIRGGISVDVADAAGRTALHAACSCGNDAGVRQLLHMGAAPNARDRIGNTPLTLAATGVRADIVVLLLEAGADPRIGGALVLATAMVRARLQLLRASIRQARAAEAALDPDDAHTIRERRIQSAAVACECVDIIRLLRYRAMNPLHEPTNPAYGAFVTTRPYHDEDDSLDDLAAQLTAQLAALRLGARPLRDAPAPDQDRAPDSPPTAAARISRGGDTEDDHMDVLLGRLSRLLGEDDDRDSA